MGAVALSLSLSFGRGKASAPEGYGPLEDEGPKGETWESPLPNFDSSYDPHQEGPA